MKSANIAEHLGKMHVLFNLALSEGIVSTNPANGIRARDFGIKLSAKRQGFTSIQVRDIFRPKHKTRHHVGGHRLSYESMRLRAGREGGHGGV